MKQVKSKLERGSRLRHQDRHQVAAAAAVKRERLSPEAAPPAARCPGWFGGSWALWAREPSHQGHHGNRDRGGSRSPAKKKSRSSGRSTPRSKRSLSPHYSTVKVKREREDQPPRGREARQHREPSEQEPRRARSSDRDRHPGGAHQERASNERPRSAQAQGPDGDVQNLQGPQAEREFHDAGSREHRQKNEVSRSGNGSQEVVPRPARNSKEKKVPAIEQPSFELSGALFEDTNTFQGVVIKYSEPPEARIPKKRWRLYPFKNEEVLPVMYIHRQSAYLLGRHQRIADIPIDHPSCSQQHAVLQYRLVEYVGADGPAGRSVRPYIIDLGSGNGTFLNNKRIEPQRYYELREKDVLKFGFSSREYVLLHESSDTSERNRKGDEDEEEEEKVSTASKPRNNPE